MIQVDRFLQRILETKIEFLALVSPKDFKYLENKLANKGDLNLSPNLKIVKSFSF